MYRPGIIYTTGQDSRKVILIFNNRILDGTIHLLLFVFLLWLFLNHLLGHATLVDHCDPIHGGLLVVGHYFKGPQVVGVVHE